MSNIALDEDSVALLRRIDQLPEKDKAELMSRLQRKTGADRQVWYCRRGRSCDGEAHEGAPYKHARGDQWPPMGSDWDIWFYMSGRGVGKTRAGSNWTRQVSKRTGRVALVGRRGTDVRQTMIEGDSGLIRACELAGETWEWKPALKEFTFENGAKAFGFSAEEPESLRGPEHGAAWLDEPCHMDLIEEVWSNLNLGLRQPGLPGGAKILLTSSPLPIPWTKERIKEEGTVLVQVPTSVNLHNLDEGYKRRVVDPLRGTRKGRQELDAILLEDVEGALWEATWHQRKLFTREECERVVVAVDPAGSDKKTADQTGIVVAGRLSEDEYGVFEDVTDHYTPAGWAMKAIEMYEKYDADAIVLERYGGDSATTILRNTRYKGRKFKGKIIAVNARVGKKTRAEPISGLYEQMHVWHLTGADLAELEQQQLTWVPAIAKDSPDRVDALVWGLTDLSKQQRAAASVGVAQGTLRAAPQNHSPGSNYARKNWNR